MVSRRLTGTGVPCSRSARAHTSGAPTTAAEALSAVLFDGEAIADGRCGRRSLAGLVINSTKTTRSSNSSFRWPRSEFFDADRGFGFISRDGGNDVFVHVSNIQVGEAATLTEGQAVEFEIGPGRKSDEAKNVRKI